MPCCAISTTASLAAVSEVADAAAVCRPLCSDEPRKQPGAGLPEVAGTDRHGGQQVQLHRHRARHVSPTCRKPSACRLTASASTERPLLQHQQSFHPGATVAGIIASIGGLHEVSMKPHHVFPLDAGVPARVEAGPGVAAAGRSTTSTSAIAGRKSHGFTTERQDAGRPVLGQPLRRRHPQRQGPPAALRL